ncbi:uncharacterized protein G2W53_044351 [Senna tora]|uniref:Uncharacterized protein n=1 Tax=Senna tora TaxID=362788 RepID=A0A834SJ32_9FABA|nr:uncharacterized protein G2W53_044351 [Senna tora]
MPESTAERKPKLDTDSPTGDSNLLAEASLFIPAPASFLVSIKNVPTTTCENQLQIQVTSCCNLYRVLVGAQSVHNHITAHVQRIAVAASSELMSHDRHLYAGFAQCTLERHQMYLERS